LNKSIVILIAIVVIATVSSALAYSNFYLVEDSDVEIRDSNVTITNSTVTYGENVTVSPTPQPVQPVQPTQNETQTEEYPTPSPVPIENVTKTFIVYRWNETTGTVTREMLDEYAAWRTLVKITLVFTYKLGEKGFVAYYDFYGQGFTVVSEHFENALSEVAEWNKSNVTVEIPENINGECLDCAYLFE